VSSFEFASEIQYRVRTTARNNRTDWITEIHGEAHAHDESGVGKLAGRGRYFFVDIDNSEQRPRHILDQSNALIPFINVLYKAMAHEFTDELMAKTRFRGWSMNLLVIDRVEVVSCYRGCGLGRKMIEDIIRLFSGRAKVAALKAVPLQYECGYTPDSQEPWDRMMQLEQLPSDHQEATQRLRGFYSRLGFVPVGEEGVMARYLG